MTLPAGIADPGYSSPPAKQFLLLLMIVLLILGWGDASMKEQDHDQDHEQD
ncbi:MAG: hypothetical protein WAO00_05245 [Chthoniobacterales bacterium]